ncbi:glycoside hydrolase family 2 TIM barrel-domain containing protein [Candidatus Arthromitus sp. SFB-rat-Yit]|uniref:glycoside hydrolase family 2 TIM barrel-domain containing protein n=1 Tax=Candidatus Arthromitus sp. SFB-rat-Yit TaxID=1041504 RepID=UPI000227A7C0|nr:glycoside hydrolase family 2 TIM barrel-domain containing protein [Candidatus Arthromitus sp. SFB-rat-Yit]BAK80685.1 beta-galactosidase [Candidatus Arthromitus sp. SFB-rat-Yit]
MFKLFILPLGFIIIGISIFVAINREVKGVVSLNSFVKEFPKVYADFNEWDDRVDVFHINREIARSFFLPYPNREILLSDVKKDPLNSVKIKDSDNIKVLNGKWKFSLDYAPKYRNLDFYKQDYDVSNWGDINVPSNWQMEGYDFPIYVNFKYPWTGFENLEFYKAPKKFNPIGNYRRDFFVDESWLNDKVYISFQGVESCFYLWINGEFVGYSEDSFSPSEFDITDFLVSGKNYISVQVFRWCDGSFLEDQDFIRLSGIFRDVFLYRTPKIHIADFEVITNADDDLKNFDLILNVNLINYLNENRNYSISTVLFDEKWNLISSIENMGNFDNSYTYKDAIKGNFNLCLNIKEPKKWSAEEPNLYNLVISLKNDLLNETQSIHTRVGFRTFEIKGNKMYINGKPILFKGVNRHETHPTKGRALSTLDMEFDVKEIKRNNINSVRTSHYPTHPYFISLCNEYGVYVIDEGNIEAHGVEGEIPGDKEIWRGACFDRINSLVERDKNNPSVLIWSLGNESGGGSIFRDLYNYVNLRDGSRIIHYEGERDKYYASDVVSKMYVRINDIEKQSKYIPNKPYILCEYAHSMGNSGGSLDKYIEKFESIDNVQGGFIWDFIDQGVYRETPCIGTFITPCNMFHGEFEGYIEDGYKGNGYKGVILYDNTKNLKFDEFTIDLKVKPSIYEGEGCVYLKKGNEFGVREITNYNKSNNRVVEFYVRDNSGIFDTIIFITPEDWVNNFHNVTATYKDNVMRLFIDDNLVGEKIFNYNIAYFKDRIQVGGNNSYTHYEGINGVIDEVKLFSKGMDIEYLRNKNFYNIDATRIIFNDFDNKRNMIKKKVHSQRYLATGGDFNDSPNDSAFCANGILLASRKLKPQVTEVKHAYQNIDIRDYDILNGKILIRNKNLFKNLKDYMLKWNYLVDGKVVQGDMAIVNVEPMSEIVFNIHDIEKINNLNGNEFFLNIGFVLNEGTNWANRGFEISNNQFKINLDNSLCEVNVNSKKIQNFIVNDLEDKFEVKSEEYYIVFNKASGNLKHYRYKNDDLINSELLIDFWNPLNDNERLFNIYDKVVFWKNISKINANNNYNVSYENGCIVIRFYRLIYDLNNSVLITTYRINEYGEISIDLYMELLKYGIPHARSVGFKVFIPTNFKNIQYYGRGPLENYNDRNKGSNLGEYKSNINNQFTDYMTPQRTGNITDIRWIDFYRNDGVGIRIENIHEFIQINASSYIDDEFEKKHSYQMSKYSSIIVNVRSKDYGSTFESFEDECINYIDKNHIYSFLFKLSPVFINNISIN